MVADIRGEALLSDGKQGARDAMEVKGGKVVHRRFAEN